MKTGLPNLLGAAIRDYFTDHLPRFGEPVRTPSTATATALFCCYGFFPDSGSPGST